MELLEVYVVSGTRSKATYVAFLDTFLPHRRALAEEFPFPEFTDPPQNVYLDPEELMERLELEPNQSYSLYWQCDESSQGLQAMLIFTCDQAMIAGLVVPTGTEGRILLEIANVVKGQFGLVTTENFPPETSAEFIDLCRTSTLIALVDGRLRGDRGESWDRE